MRYVITDKEPTDRELNDIKEGHAVLEGVVLGGDYKGKFIVGFDDKKYDLPIWLENKETLNIPGKPHRCGHCGELI